jgi:GAF domain-containing protein
VIGVLDLDSPNLERFDQDDARGLEALADVYLNAADIGD